jgi:hypothetical protein
MENRTNELHNTAIGSALSFSFNAFFSHILQWLKTLLIMMLWLIPGVAAAALTVQMFIVYLRPIFGNIIVIIPNWVGTIGIPHEQYAAFTTSMYPELIMGTAVGLFAMYYLSAMHLGVRRSFINYYDNGEIAFSPTFNVRMILSNILATSMLLFLIIGGLILFIIPGIIVILRSLFVGLIIVDKNVGPIEAIKASWALTKGKSNITLGLLIMMIAVSTLIPIAGMFMAGLMMIYVYRVGLLK